MANHRMAIIVCFNFQAVDAVCLLGTQQCPAEFDNFNFLEGPIYSLVIQKKLHLEVLTLNQGQLTMRRHSHRISDNGCFDLLPREAVLYIFRHLDFLSLVRCSQVSKLFHQVSFLDFRK